MKIRLLMLAAAVATLPTMASAQTTIERGVNDGAAAGGQVLGPAGAIVGGTVGAAVGTAAAIPEAVIMSVRGAPAHPVTVREEIVVGERLPASVRLYSVRDYPNYRYAVVNDQRVIVEPRSRKIVHVIEE